MYPHVSPHLEYLMIQFHNTDRPAPLYIREGLTRYLKSRPDRPDLLSEAAVAALSDFERAAYNRARIVFLSGGILVNTPQLKQARATITQLLAENLGRNSGHHGLMLSADSTLGKTTISKALMTYIFTMYQRQFPDFETHDHVPVVYVEVPAGCTGKLLMAAFARFFGMTIARSDTMDNIRHRVVGALNAAGTQLIVVDELHNLSASNHGNGESVDVLKALHNQVPATFIYAGIGLNTGELLGGTRGAQISARFTTIELTRFTLSDTEHAKTWRGIVQQFEKALPLTHHEPGTLVALSNYLHQRTNGSIGSLGRLITGAAIDLIVNPNGRPESITKELLDSRTIDVAAETAFLRTTARTAKKNGTN